MGNPYSPPNGRPATIHLVVASSDSVCASVWYLPGQANPPCVVHYLSTTMTHQTETEQNSFGSLASQAIIT